jgi:hypothetical protein
MLDVEPKALVAGEQAERCHLDDGTRVTGESARRLTCDCSVVEVTRCAHGSVLDVGRKTRRISTPMRRALEARDGGCRFPGCGLTLCDAHHVEHWADGGATRLDNLLQLCRRHHRAVHEEGFGVELRPDGEAVFRRPDGRILAPAPEPPGGGDRIRALLDHLAARRIEVDPAASRPNWDGGPCDYNWALQWLRSRDPAEAETEPS